MRKLAGIMVVVLTAVLMTVGAALAAEVEDPGTTTPEESQGYLQINGVSYDAQEIRAITSCSEDLPASMRAIVEPGDTIEVYGKVDLPLNARVNKIDSATQQYTWVLDVPDVTVKGMTDDATVFCSHRLAINVVDEGKETILVTAPGVTIEDLTVMPNIYSMDGEGDCTNKTIEVHGPDFTLKNVTITPNLYVASDDQHPVVPADGGALYINGQLYFDGAYSEKGLKNILVEN